MAGRARPELAALGRISRVARRLGRRLTPPGSRTPLEESLQQKPGLASDYATGTQREHLDVWLSKDQQGDP